MKSILYIASQNVHKIEEIIDLLGDIFDVQTVFSLGLEEEIPETGFTLAENSMQKAAFIAAKYNITCLADDSGLEVEALGGKPGVFSARYAGEPKNDTANLQKLLHDLKGIANRQARFVTVLTFHHQGVFTQFSGEIVGSICEEPRGLSGFGYDPIFVPKGLSKTFAELTLAEKNQMAHRARAMQKFRAFINESVLL